MDAEKRKLIIQEIEGWQRSRMLPKQYCDFLLNLYLDEEDGPTKSVMGLPQRKIQNSRWQAWFLIFGSFSLISYFVLHFTSFSPAMQMATSVFFAVLAYWIGAVQHRKRPLLSNLTLGLGAIMLLCGGLFSLGGMGASSLGAAGFMAVCSLLWMVAGLLVRVPFFHFSGWIVLSLIYGWLLESNIPAPDWGGLQMAWLPACVLLVWFGWLFHHRDKQIGAVLLTVGFLMWFAPEIQGLAAAELSINMIQLWLMAKLAAAGTALFAWRKKWTEWVA